MLDVVFIKTLDQLTVFSVAAASREYGFDLGWGTRQPAGVASVLFRDEAWKLNISIAEIICIFRSPMGMVTQKVVQYENPR